VTSEHAHVITAHDKYLGSQGRATLFIARFFRFMQKRVEA